MDNKVYMFGLNPVDFLILLPSLLFVFIIAMAAFDILGFFASLFVGITGPSFLLAVGFSGMVKNRPRGIHLYVRTFFDVPTRLGIPQRAESNYGYGKRTISN